MSRRATRAGRASHHASMAVPIRSAPRGSGVSTRIARLGAHRRPIGIGEAGVAEAAAEPPGAQLASEEGLDLVGGRGGVGGAEELVDLTSEGVEGRVDPGRSLGPVGDLGVGDAQRLLELVGGAAGFLEGVGGGGGHAQRPLHCSRAGRHWVAWQSLQA